MAIKPLADRVLVRPSEPEEKQSSGIIIPDTAKEKPQEGEVVAVGPGKVDDAGKRVAMEVKKGDKVLYGKYSGTEVTVDGDDFLIMRESDILAVV
jgi:chaperonin GroES